MTSESRSANLASTLEVLQGEFEKEIDLANRAVTNALSTEDHGKAGRLLQRSQVLTAFRDKVAGLRKEWRKLAVSVDPDEEEQVNTPPDRGRLPPGRARPLREFVEPTLRVLQKMGGSGEADAVVERVERIMQPVLRDVDYEALSDGMPRWKKNVHWARWKMVQDGLMRRGSPRGLWEISKEGRLHLGA